MSNKTNTPIRPQVKICGLTDVDQALACAQLGANAIGFIFFPKSPRHLTEEKARDISSALPNQVTSVGVFVNRSFSDIMKTVDKCRLKAVQLHGQEEGQFRRDRQLVYQGLYQGATLVTGTPRRKLDYRRGPVHR